MAHPVSARRSRVTSASGSPPSLPDATDITRLLQAWAHGDAQARDQLIPLVYGELRKCAVAYLRKERPDHTLQPTALVHEAFLRLTDASTVSWQNRAHFLAIAARIMRRVLVDYARERRAAKRPQAGMRVELAEDVTAAGPLDAEVLELDLALDGLAVLDARQAQIVELKYFGGLTEQEVADALSISRATVAREWQVARAWLFRSMTGGDR